MFWKGLLSLARKGTAVECSGRDLLRVLVVKTLCRGCYACSCMYCSLNSSSTFFSKAEFEDVFLLLIILPPSRRIIRSHPWPARDSDKSMRTEKRLQGVFPSPVRVCTVPMSTYLLALRSSFLLLESFHEPDFLTSLPNLSSATKDFSATALLPLFAP